MKKTFNTVGLGSLIYFITQIWGNYSLIIFVVGISATLFILFFSGANRDNHFKSGYKDNVLPIPFMKRLKTASIVF